MLAYTRETAARYPETAEFAGYLAVHVEDRFRGRPGAREGSSSEERSSAPASVRASQ